ncbi:type II secretion system F family protein [Kitasatospora sp. NPDC050543]|uniref:type II secretion system F family protein n=1 Tax=Kitasatospora sp. NPDC050543 TaxID=3364054 RepID=UPI00379FF63E
MYQVQLCWAAVLCAVTLAGRQALQRQVAGVRRSKLLLVSGRSPRWDPAASARRRLAELRALRPPWLVPELLLLPAGLVAAQATGSPVPLIGAAGAVVPVRRWRVRRGRVLQARRRAGAVVELCTALAAELRSGATPRQALENVTSRLGEDRSLLRRLGAGPVARLAAGRYGADVPAAFQALAQLPGGRGAAAVAACWQVTAGSGAGLAAGLDQVAEALRAERGLAEEIEGELAGSQATIAVLAALPAVGLLLGMALGARPIGILLHTPAGLACLVIGLALEGVGLAWTTRIIRRAKGAGAQVVAEVPGRQGGGPSTGGRAGAGEPSACGITRRRAVPPAAGGQLPQGQAALW